MGAYFKYDSAQNMGLLSEKMYDATVHTRAARMKVEAELLEKVIEAGKAFRTASDENKAAARQEFAEVLAAFNEVVLGGEMQWTRSCDFLDVLDQHPYSARRAS